MVFACWIKSKSIHRDIRESTPNTRFEWVIRAFLELASSFAVARVCRKSVAQHAIYEWMYHPSSVVTACHIFFTIYNGDAWWKWKCAGCCCLRSSLVLGQTVIIYRPQLVYCLSRWWMRIASDSDDASIRRWACIFRRYFAYFRYYDTFRAIGIIMMKRTTEKFDSDVD